MIGLLIALYPRQWRDRYGDELAQILADTGLSPGTIADLLMGALRERIRGAAAATTGGIMLTFGPAWRHPRAFALIGLLVMLPTLTFVVLSMLAYELHVTGLEPLMESASVSIQAAPRLVDLVLVLAPGLAFLVAVVPLVKVGLDTEGERSVTVGVRLRAANLAVAALAAVIGGVLVWHIVVESVLLVGP